MGGSPRSDMGAESTPLFPVFMSLLTFADMNQIPTSPRHSFSSVLVARLSLFYLAPYGVFLEVRFETHKFNP